MPAAAKGCERQPKLYNLRFGVQRAKRASGSRADETGGGVDDAVKKQKRLHESLLGRDEVIVLDDDDDDDDDDDVDDDARHSALRKDPAHTGIGTTTDPMQLFPVTRQEFLQRHAVKDMQDVYYQRNWLPVSTAHRWRRELDLLLEWYRPKLRVYGREIQQSRAIAAFSTAPGLDLKYSGHQVDMHSPFPPLLEEIAARLAQPDCLGADVKFNHAMLNRYEDGSVYIGKHSDNIENKVIVTVSLGAPRTWIMEEKRPRARKTASAPPSPLPLPKRHRWILDNGSLLVMQGDVQHRYTHEIPKELKVKEPRIVSEGNWVMDGCKEKELN